jgi:hypothetical protein
MSYATAAETASVRIINWNVPPPIASIPGGHLLPYVTPDLQLSDTKQEKDIREVRPISATWLNALNRRIQKSTAPLGRKIDNDLRWLSQDIAEAASAFFKTTSDVLPGEPHIYSSLKGDLVAEFSGAHGTMTNIVSQTSVIVFAVVDEDPVEKRLELCRSETDALRQELQRLTKMLSTGRHVIQMEPKN